MVVSHNATTIFQKNFSPEAQKSRENLAIFVKSCYTFSENKQRIVEFDQAGGRFLWQVMEYQQLQHY